MVPRTGQSGNYCKQSFVRLSFAIVYWGVRRALERLCLPAGGFSGYRRRFLRAVRKICPAPLEAVMQQVGPSPGPF